MTSSPEVEEFSGRGHIFSEKKSDGIEVDFQLHRSTSGYYFTFDIDQDSVNWLRMAANSDDSKRIVGVLESGDKVRCDRVFLSTFDVFFLSEDTELSLLPLSEIILGEHQELCDSVEVYLQGSLQLNTEVLLPNYKIKITSHKPSLREKHLYSQEHLSLATSTVIRIEADSVERDKYNNIYECLSRVLCLGIARSVSAKRFRYFYADGSWSEEWKDRKGYGSGARPIVHKSSIPEYLEECLIAYSSLGEDEQQKFHLASAYLAISEGGFSDLQALQIIQAWELYASWHAKSEEKSTDQLREETLIEGLVDNIKECYEDWLTKHPKMKSRSIIWDRATAFIHRTSASDSMGNLVARTGLKADEVGLRLGFHRSLANSVRHTGSLPDGKDVLTMLKTMNASRLALRLILLRSIGYTGYVEMDNGKGSIRKDSILSYFESSDEHN